MRRRVFRNGGLAFSALEQGAGQPVLVGHDLGAVIAYLVAAKAPERLRSLFTIAIAHPGRMQRELLRKRPSQLGKSWYMFFFQLRGLAEHVVERDDWAFIERLWRDWSPGWAFEQAELAAVKLTLAQPGVKRTTAPCSRCSPRRRAKRASSMRDRSRCQRWR